MIYIIAEHDLSGTIATAASTGYVKIGFVAPDDETAARVAIKERLVKLQSGNPRRIVVIGMTPGGRKEEKALHYRFTAQRVRRPIATEWVLVNETVASWIETVKCTEFGITHHVGEGSKGGKVYRKGSNCCSYCSSSEHTALKCEQWQIERRAKRDREQAIAKPIPRSQRSKLFTWRGATRPWHPDVT